MFVDGAKAESAGLTYRPLENSVAECLAWQAVRRGWSQRWLDPAREQDLIRQWQR
jgi:2'-hydroxyisoflavone reductase